MAGLIENIRKPGDKILWLILGSALSMVAGRLFLCLFAEFMINTEETCYIDWEQILSITY